jgi:hypothetical protein
MPRRNTHAGYVPGQGCGCALCREPLPEVKTLSAEEYAALRAAYVAYRRGHLTALGYSETLGRGGAQGPSK